MKPITLRRLLNVAARATDEHNIAVYFLPNHLDAQVDPYPPQKILVGIDDEPWRVCAVLGHEVGHCLRFKRKHTSTRWNLDDANAAVRNGTATAAQWAIFLREERAAWKEGFSFLKRCGIIVDDKMKRFAIECTEPV